MKRKQGFGIIEVLIGAAVLGFLYIAVLNLQSGNRDALLRVRARDGATEVAQNLIDSLGAGGIAVLTDLDNDTLVVEDIERTWTGTPGVLSHTMKVKYSATVVVSPDTLYEASATSLYDTITSVYAKRLDVTVSWPFKKTTQSIRISGIVK